MALAEGPGSLNEDANNGRTLYLVDGSAYIFRAYHALPPLTRSDGMPVGAVRGFMTMMLRLVEDHARDYFAVIFDASGVTFRNDIYDQYKANRDAPPEDLKPQFGLVRDATRASTSLVSRKTASKPTTSSPPMRGKARQPVWRSKFWMKRH